MSRDMTWQECAAEAERLLRIRPNVPYTISGAELRAKAELWIRLAEVKKEEKP